MALPVDLVRGSLPGVVWPAVPGPAGALILAMQHQLDESQWLSAPELEELQLRQLAVMLRHAHAHAPYWSERLGRAGYDPGRELSMAWLRTLPLLSRSEL